MDFYLVRRKADITKGLSNWIDGDMCHTCSKSIICEIEQYISSMDGWWVNKSHTDQLKKEYV